MNRATPQMRIFARHLIAHEAVRNKSEPESLAAFPVADKLRPHLVSLMGQGGFRALLSRSLALAQMEVPALRTLQVNADGTLAGLEELHAQLAPDEFLECRTVLLAQLLGLLVAFIGVVLTVRLVREVWAKVRLDELDFNNGGKNEKAKN